MKGKRLIDEGSLWIMVAAPSIWAAHFLLCYWIAAVRCARATGGDVGLDDARLWMWGLTVVALALIGWIARHAVRRYGGTLRIEDDLTDDSLEEREAFLGHATLLLCCLSAAAVLFDLVPTLIFATCD